MNRPVATVSATASSSGIGLGGAFALLFTVLKLTGYITWSWWLVLAPLWAPALAFLLFLVVGAVMWVVISSAREREAAQRAEARRRRQQGLPAENEHGPRRKWGPRGG